MYQKKGGASNLRAFLIVVSRIAEHQLHIFQHWVFGKVLVWADIVLYGPQVHWFQDDFVVVGIVLLRRLDHEEVTQSATSASFSRLIHSSKESFHPVFLRILLVTRSQRETTKELSHRYHFPKKWPTLENSTSTWQSAPFSFCATGVRGGRGEHAVAIIIISL